MLENYEVEVPLFNPDNSQQSQFCVNIESPPF